MLTYKHIHGAWFPAINAVMTAKLNGSDNVSGRENAFNVLDNLFLCKIVDEAENATDLWSEIRVKAQIPGRLSERRNRSRFSILGQPPLVVQQLCCWSQSGNALNNVTLFEK